MSRILVRAVALCVVLASLLALAGETLIGTLTSTGSAVANIGLLSDGGTVQADAGVIAITAVPFVLPRDAKISIQCDAASYIYMSDQNIPLSATSTNAIKLAADAFFLTSTPPGNNGQSAMFMSMISSTGTSNCRVYTRRGNEN